jgi:hypothetical protein
MECSISVAGEDQGTAHIAEALRPYLESLSLRLSRDYGGSMQHLWIDVEMCPAHADRRLPWSFRFQKRVSRARTAKLFRVPKPDGAADFLNVGHYSVRPDYAELAELQLREISAYVINLIYGEAAVLERKSQRLGGFDATRFRQDILTYIDEMRSSQERMV